MSKTDNYANTGRAELLDLLPESFNTVLDIGCYSGIFLANLAENYPDIETWGIEPDPEAASIARERCQDFIEGTVEDQIVYQATANVVAERLLPKVRRRYNKEVFGHLYAGKSSKWFYRKWSDGYARFNAAARAAP